LHVCEVAETCHPGVGGVVVGEADGAVVGADGALDGADVGELLGASVGEYVGLLGASVGEYVAPMIVGVLVGAAVGTATAQSLGAPQQQSRFTGTASNSNAVSHENGVAAFGSRHTD
jgi:xanthosine utilization system XapX-like protein